MATISKMSRSDKNGRENDKIKAMGGVENFMGGISYEWNPIDTLKMVTASSIFGEPAYYRDGAFSSMKILDGNFTVDPAMVEYSVKAMDKYKGMKTSELMEKVIDDALAYDFGATLKWADTLRHDYLMRLNPQVIMVRAAINENRNEWTKDHPGEFNRINKSVMSRGDDVIVQATYYSFINGGKAKLPSILKRSWADNISNQSRYSMGKYKNHEIGMIDVIRMCHAKGELVNELMKTGTIEVQSNEKTWESMRAGGATWEEILNSDMKMGHMALLRNLRGIFTEITDVDTTDKILDELVGGVEKGKQFPFRYMSAIKAVDHSDAHNKVMIKDSLEDCMDRACSNLPKLHGTSAFLTDNSGSAWGTMNSEYGSVTIAEIDNLSAVIGAANSQKGTVFAFGDRLMEYPISKRDGILHQAQHISEEARRYVGGGTENGIWLFMRDAIKNKTHYDNIFVYSDMQAGHGGLYGIRKDMADCSRWGCTIDSRYNSTYVDFAKLVDKYRKEVNPKVNVFCIQTAGYDNVLVPENGYRMSLMYGWTGKELVYADAINKMWDEKDRERERYQAKNHDQDIDRDERER